MSELSDFHHTPTSKKWVSTRKLVNACTHTRNHPTWLLTLSRYPFPPHTLLSHLPSVIHPCAHNIASSPDPFKVWIWYRQRYLVHPPAIPGARPKKIWMSYLIPGSPPCDTWITVTPGVFHIKIINFCTKTIKIQKNFASRRAPYPEPKKSKIKKTSLQNSPQTPFRHFSTFFHNSTPGVQLSWFTLKFHQSKNTIRIK